VAKAAVTGIACVEWLIASGACEARGVVAEAGVGAVGQTGAVGAVVAGR